ncbi:uncharacterized protein METZ01_LOCUS91670 [marine metagenome]|uniref:Uncharacterized protein n=1 Tax=marine metagenome TaxID=408172 RepID=A0A381VEN0_9ZZZZ
MSADALGEDCALLGIELCGDKWPGQAAAVVVFGDDVKVNMEY